MMDEPGRRSFRAFILHPSTFILFAILLSSFVLKLHHLGHQSLKPLDEAFHAVVARNMMDHPLWPTLNEGITIPTQPGDWQNGDIWLHKPPMALWQIVISFKTLGVSTFALRLPSATLATAAVLLTYLIGRRLVDPIAALVAAGLQAFNPVIVALVHGQVFSDHVDISLLFWTELSIYLLIRAIDGGGTRDLILCGVAQGLAFLSKTYPALIVTGVAAVAWGLGGMRMNAKRFGIILLAMLLTIAPWTIWALVHWPRLYMQETLHVFRHLTENIEDWAAPWDRLPFDHWVQAFHVFYPAVLVGIGVTIYRASREKNPRLWLLVAWMVGVAVPHLLATSKPPVGTLVGWPAMWLMLGYLVSRAVKGDALCMGLWLFTMLAPIVLRTENYTAGGIGTSVPAAGELLRARPWVIWYPLVALIGTLAIIARTKGDTSLLTSFAARLVVAAIALALPMCQHVARAYQVTIRPSELPSFQSLAPFAQALPANAVLMVDEQVGAENKVIQFAVDRTCYPVRSNQIEVMSRSIVSAGGVPVLISPSAQPFPVLFRDDSTGRIGYDVRPD